jgi:hypothetical protein
MSTVTVAISMDDGSLSVMEFCVTGRSPTLPPGATWSVKGGDAWVRPPTDVNIAAEIAKALPTVEGRPQPVGFKLVDRSVFPADRTYRNAWKLEGAKVVHDMPRARERHRELLRHESGNALMALEREWVPASHDKDNVALKRIGDEHKRLREFPNDPRIEAATTIDELRAIK